MKKIIITLFTLLICCFSITACKNNNYVSSDNSKNISKYNESVESTHFNGEKIYNINSVETPAPLKSNNLKYIEPQYDSNGAYVMLSENYIYKDTDAKEDESIDRREILPKKIYTSEANALYIYRYNKNFYFIPTEVCDLGKEKILFRDYGLELEKNSITFNGQILNKPEGFINNNGNNIVDVYLEKWKKPDISGKYTSKVYEFDIDDDTEYSREFYFIGVDSDMILCYTNENELKAENFILSNNIGYKNIFYITDESGIYCSLIPCINENVIMGYYLYDKNNGFIKIKRFANGELIQSNNDFENLAFTLKKDLGIITSGDESYILDYSTDGYVTDSNLDLLEDLVLVFEDNPSGFGCNHFEYSKEKNAYIGTVVEPYLKANQKVHLQDVNENGTSMTIITEDGSKYHYIGGF